MKITVAIVTRNRSVLLDACFFSLVHQTSTSFEVLVIDNGSTDSTKSVCDLYNDKLPLTYIYEKRIGIAHARNRALKESRGDILVFIDDDCEAEKKWIENIIKAHKQYPHIAAIQGRQISRQSKFLQKYITFPYELWIRLNTKKDGTLLICDTKNFSIKMKIVKRHQFHFDSNYTRGSDVDFAKQMLLVGEIIKYNSEIIVTHQERRFFYSSVMQRLYQDRAYPLQRIKWPSFLFPEEESSDAIVLNKKSYLLQFCILIFNTFISPDYPTYLYKNRSKIVAARTRITGHISVVIVTRNREKLLKSLLYSLVVQTMVPLEVIVIDNASTDHTKKIVFSFKNKLPIKYIYEKHIGIPYARNTGLKNAKGPIIAYIDDDCEATTTWVEEMVNAHKMNPDFCAIQGYSDIIRKESFLAKFSGVMYQKWVESRLSPKEKNVPRTISTLVTSNVSFKKTILQEFNIKFDTRFFRGEDSDLASQILSKEQKILYYKHAEIRYHPRSTLYTFIEQRYNTGRGNALLIQKWPNYFIRQKLNIKIKDIISFWEIYKYPLLVILRFIEEYAYSVGYLVENALYRYIDLIGEKELRKGNVYENILLNFAIKTTIQEIYGKKNKFFKIVLIYITKKYLYKLLPIYKKQYSIITTRERENFHPSLLKGRINNPTVTIGIPTHNRANYLYYCLRSIISQDKFFPTEIIIINNDSTDETEAIVNILKMRFHFIKSFSIRGKSISMARNKILELSSSDIIAFVDDDVTLFRNWLITTLRAHMQYPEACVIQGQSFNVPQNNIYVQVMSYLKHLQFHTNLHVSLTNYRSILMNSEKKGYPIATLDTRNCSIKKEKLKNIDQYFDITCLRDEDTDFARRLLANKQQIIFYPYSKVYHWERNRLVPFLYKNFMRGRSTYIIEKKWALKSKNDSFFSTCWRFLAMQDIADFLQLLAHIYAYSIYKGIFHIGYIFEKYKGMLVLPSSSFFLSSKRY